jgi:hypothetical protein
MIFASIISKPIYSMKYLMSIILLVITCSCAIKKGIKCDDVIGVYYWQSIYGVGSSISIDKDSTFEYNWVMGLNSGMTEGNWKLFKNNLILNSNEQPEVEVIKKINLLSDSTYICIDSSSVLQNSYDLDFTSVKIVKKDKSSERLKLDSNYRFVFFTKNVDSVYIYSIFKTPIRLAVNELNYNHYCYKMKPDKSRYRYFTNDIWKYKNNRLYNTSIRKSRYNKVDYYKKKEV